MPVNNSRARRAQRREDAEKRQAAYDALTDEQKAAKQAAYLAANPKKEN